MAHLPVDSRAVRARDYLSLIAVLALAGSCAGPVESPKPPPAPPASTAVTAPTGVTVAAEAPTASVAFEYVKPTNPAHEVLYAEMKERQVLEKFANVLGILRLPKTLTLRFKGCNGTSNAFYLDVDASISFCYEFLDDIKKAAKKSRKKGALVTLDDAVDGPVAFFMLHETGHAVFDLLKVPVLGKEEDAADAFAAITILRLGKEQSLRLLRGAAWAYAQDASTAKLDESDYSDIHSLDSQRYYNLLCLAYGSDPEYYADAVKRGKLPADRARWCGIEYHQALYAIQKLIAPSIDQRKLERLRASQKVPVDGVPSQGSGVLSP